MSRAPLFSDKNSLYRILVVDGMELIRVGLVQIISAASQLLVCAATGDYDDVPDLIERHCPHLMVAEPFRQHGDGIMWIKNLHADHRQMKILIASANSEATYAERLLRAGASGYWMNTGSAEEVLRAIDTVLSGELYVSPTMRLLAMHKLVERSARNRDLLSELSDRELAVFSFIAARHGTGQIAKELGISRKTIETHCAHIKLKLGYPDAAALKRGAQESLG
jgi:DNA-binding NarL/FixJ family response regulator